MKHIKDQETGKNGKWPRKLHICPKVTKMGPIIGHRIDYYGQGALTDQPKITQVPPPPPGGIFDGTKTLTQHTTTHQHYHDFH